MQQHDTTTSPDDGVAPDAPDAPDVRDVRDQSGRELATLLARIGEHLDADRVELHRCLGPDFVLVGTWRPGGNFATDLARSIPTSWFPWNLGNLHAVDHFFVRNAAPLLLHPSGLDTVASLGMESAVQIAVRSGVRSLGAVCAYWSTERSSWSDGTAGQIMDLALQALDPPIPPAAPRRPGS